MTNIWNNLLENKCPKCRCGLVVSDDGIVECGRPKCSFKISKIRLTQVIQKLHAPLRRKMFEHTEEENLEELNKL